MTVTINGSSGVAVPLGSVSAPGVSNTTSSTTGIYNPTGTTLGIATNGVNAVYVDASQNVGIGTVTPLAAAGYKFTTLGAGSTGGGYNINNSGGTEVGRYFTDGTQIGLWTSSSLPLTFSVIGGTERMRIDTSGNLQVGGSTVTNTAGYVNSRTNARAWCNFNGTLTTPITPRANYNISSVTKNGTGDYTLNFTTALADANYVVSGSGGLGSTNLCVVSVQYNVTTPTTSAVRVNTSLGNGTVNDLPWVTVAVFGN